MTMFRVALGLGSNTGPTRLRLSLATESLTSLLASPMVASLYRTEPLSDLAQPFYLNTAIVGTTDLSAEAILAIAKHLEQMAGRISGPRNSPRPLDIDLLLHGDRTCDYPELTLPHPRLRERAFALVPLGEIAPDWPLPPDGKTVREALADLGKLSGIERLDR